MSATSVNYGPPPFDEMFDPAEAAVQLRSKRFGERTLGAQLVHTPPYLEAKRAVRGTMTRRFSTGSFDLKIAGLEDPVGFKTTLTEASGGAGLVVTPEVRPVVP